MGFVGTTEGLWQLIVRVRHLDDTGDLRADAVFTVCSSKAARSAAGDADGMFKRVDVSVFKHARSSGDTGIVSLHVSVLVARTGDVTTAECSRVCAHGCA